MYEGQSASRAQFILYCGGSWRIQKRAFTAIVGYHNKIASEHQEIRFKCIDIIA